MGICASCLGLRRRNSYDPENSRLLYNDDPFQSNYGTLHNAPNGGIQPDPQSAKREREALETITQRTSDSVIDIFALQPPNPSVPAHDKSSKSIYYHSLLKNVLTVDDMKKARPSILNGNAYKRPDSSQDDDFGTVRRSRQGKLVKQIALD